MWINFESSRPFAVKVYLGGVNAISGEPQLETTETIERQKKKLASNKSIQDYLVPPEQYWLDGIASTNGKVEQFVAVSSNTDIQSRHKLLELISLAASNSK